MAYKVISVRTDTGEFMQDIGSQQITTHTKLDALLTKMEREGWEVVSSTTNGRLTYFTLHQRMS